MVYSTFSGTLVAWCIDNDTVLENVPLEEFQKYSDIFEDDVYDAISLETCVNMRTSEGGPSPDSVLKQIKSAREKLQ